MAHIQYMCLPEAGALVCLRKGRGQDIKLLNEKDSNTYADG